MKTSRFTIFFRCHDDSRLSRSEQIQDEWFDVDASSVSGATRIGKAMLGGRGPKGVRVRVMEVFPVTECGSPAIDVERAVQS